MNRWRAQKNGEIEEPKGTSFVNFREGYMLLNPLAAKKLKEMTVCGYYPYITHARRNELVQMFLEEEGRLLDQKAESTVKHIVEIYSKSEISYEEYIERIEHVSNEEAVRGAAYGGGFARNRVFDFAQKALERAKDQVYAISLADAKKRYEIEKQTAEESMKAVAQQYVATVEAFTQQHDTELTAIAQQQKEDLMRSQETIIDQTKAEIKQILSIQLQDERDRQAREIREQEDMRPAREAARTAIERVAGLEKRRQTYKRLKIGLVGLGVMFFFVLFIALLFFPLLPRWAIAMLLAVIASIFITSYVWKSPIAEDKIAEDKRQVALYQTKSEDYAALSEEERCTLLVQRIL